MDQDLPNDAKLQFRLPQQWHDDFVRHVQADHRDPVDVLRELVRAFNTFSADGRRPIYPLLITNPGVMVTDDNVTIVRTGSEFGMDAPHKTTYPTSKKKTPHKSTQSGAA